MTPPSKSASDPPILSVPPPPEIADPASSSRPPPPEAGRHPLSAMHTVNKSHMVHRNMGFASSSPLCAPESISVNHYPIGRQSLPEQTY